MNKELEKLLFNPVRLKILSFLFSVENASFVMNMEILYLLISFSSLQAFTVFMFSQEWL